MHWIQVGTLWWWKVCERCLIPGQMKHIHFSFTEFAFIYCMWECYLYSCATSRTDGHGDQRLGMVPDFVLLPPSSSSSSSQSSLDQYHPRHRYLVNFRYQYFRPTPDEHWENASAVITLSSSSSLWPTSNRYNPRQVVSRLLVDRNYGGDRDFSRTSFHRRIT